jgi:tetratricopeptide (TPR) repeat protein
LGTEGEESAQLRGKTLEESLEFYKKSLLILLRVKGEANEEVAEIYEKMARVHQELGNKQESIQYYGKTLNSRQAIYNANHPLIVKTHKAIADNYFEIQDYPLAIRFYQEFQRVGIPIYGETHNTVLKSYERVGDAHMQVGNTKEALRNYQLWGKAVQKSPTLGKKHPEMARVYHKLGNVYYVLGDIPRADQAKKIAVDIMYPGIQQETDLLRAKFYVGVHSNDVKRNRAKVSLPDNTDLDFGTLEYTLPSNQSIRIIPLPVINEYEIQNVDMAQTAAGKGLLFYFDSAATSRLSKLTTNSRSLSLVLLIDDKPMGVRPIDAQILNGQLFTLVEIPDELLDKLVFSLKETCSRLSPNHAIGG